MYNFTVADMTCGHCASTIEKAVKSADPAANVSVDIPARKVQVETTRSVQDIADAINSAGYSSTITA